MKSIVFIFLFLANIYFAAGQIDTFAVDSGYLEPSEICTEKISYEGATSHFALVFVEDIAKVRVESIQGGNLVFEMYVSFDPVKEIKQNDTIYFKYVKSFPVSIRAYTSDSYPLWLWTKDMTDGNIFLEKYNITTTFENIEKYLSNLKYYTSPIREYDDMNCTHEGTYMYCVSPSYLKDK